MLLTVSGPLSPPTRWSGGRRKGVAAALGPDSDSEGTPAPLLLNSACAFTSFDAQLESSSMGSTATGVHFVAGPRDFRSLTFVADPIVGRFLEQERTLESLITFATNAGIDCSTIRNLPPAPKKSSHLGLLPYANVASPTHAGILWKFVRLPRPHFKLVFVALHREPVPYLSIGQLRRNDQIGVVDFAAKSVLCITPHRNTFVRLVPALVAPKGKKFVFELETADGDAVMLSAASEQDLQSWLNAMQLRLQPGYLERLESYRAKASSLALDDLPLLDASHWRAKTVYVEADAHADVRSSYYRRLGASVQRVG